MKPEEIKAIILQRLGSWAPSLEEEHATPILLVGVGHDHKLGQVVLCTTEDMSIEETIGFLAGAMAILLRRSGGPA